MSDTNIPAFITPDALREHWQGHRKLTRRTIEAFPADKLFDFSVGNMRSFGELAKEMLGMAVPTLDGLITGNWGGYEAAKVATRDELLAGWDAATKEIDEKWPQVPVAHFQDVVTAFGQWTMPAHGLVLYLVDNEIHHRGQGYVYLRALGIEPPPFWER
ncbi:MAG: DinB family protein [bacterium]